MKRRELKTKSEYENKKEFHKDAAFESGCVYGYYRVLELIKQQIEADGIPLSVFSLNGFDLDKELLRNE